MAEQDQDQGPTPPALPSADNVTSFILAQQQRARMGAMQPMVESPDDAQRAMELAKSSGADPSLVAADLDGFEARQKAAYTDEILKSNKYLMDYANSHPLATSFSNGDWGNLDKFSQTLQKGGRANTVARVAKDFAEGMGLDKPIGLFGMDEPTLDEVYAHPGYAAILGAASVVGALPDLALRSVGGAINAITQSLRRPYEALTGKDATEQSDQFLQAISDPAAMASIGPAASEASEVLGMGLRERAKMKAEFDKVMPYLKAGEAPPPGVSEAIDKVRQQEQKEFSKTLKEQGAAANATNKITGDAEDFKNFVNIHNPEHIELQADAVRSLYGEDIPTPGDDRFGDIPGFEQELQLAERHGGHVQVPLADWFLFANKNPEEAKFLEKFAAMPGGVTQADGELAAERKAAVPAEEVEEPKIQLERTPSAIEEGVHKFAINGGGKPVGELHIVEQDNGKTLNVKWIGGTDLGEGFAPNLGVGGLRDILDQVKQEFPNAERLTGERITGARAQAGTEGDTSIKLRPSGSHAQAMASIRDAAGLKPIFAQGQGIIPETAKAASIRVGGSDIAGRIFPAKDAIAMIDKDQLTGVPRALAEFFHDRLTRLAGDTGVWVAPTKAMPSVNKAANVRPRVPGFYLPDADAIAIREDFASGVRGHDEATHLLIHELAHAATYHEMEEFPAIKEAVGSLMKETDRWLSDVLPEDRKLHDYAFTNEHEFIAETFSNPRFQEVLSATPLSNELASKLGLHAKTNSVWDAVKNVVGKLVERLLGMKIPPTILDGMMRIGEAVEEASKLREGKDGEALPAQEREPELPGVTRMESRSAFRTPGATGLSADAMRRYLGLIEKQQQVEADHVASKAMEDERKRQTTEWKENEKRVRGEVREGINRRPVIAADRYLREGILEGKKAGAFKLDKGALTDEQLRSLSPDYYSSGGANPDDMAKLFGYQSGDALVSALGQLKAERDLEGLTPQAHISKMVSVATEHEMQRQYGDLEENILREAKEHVFSPSQIDILADETIHLASLAGSELPITKEDLLKGARQVFDASPLRAISSKAFEASSGRAGQAVQDALLKGDYRAALKAKQEQANAAIYANLALKWEKKQKRFLEVDAPRMGRRDPPGMRQEDAVWNHQILYQVLGPDGIQTFKQDLERRKEMSSPYKNLREYVEAKNKSNGTASTDPNNPTTVSTLAVMPDLFSENWPGKAWDGLSVAEADAVINSTKSIDHYGHEIDKYTVKGDKVQLKEVVNGLVERLKAAVDNKTAVDNPHETSVFRNIGSLLLNTETWMNRLDLGNRQGPFNQLIIRPIVEGQYELRQFEKDFAARWKDLGTYPDFNKSITNTLFRDKNGFIEMTKGNAYVVLQNMGNALQRRKLIQGWGIDKDQAVGEQKVWDWLKNVAGMTKEDLDRAQKMGKIFNDAFEHSEKAWVHTAGVAPARIELYKVQTPWGNADEWYHPLIADPLRHQSHWTAEEAMQAGETGFWKPSPAHGYTKGRTGAVYPIDLSFKSAAFKLRQILNDAAMRIPITEVGKIIYNKEFQEAFKRYYGPEYHSALDAWMKDSAGNRQWQPGNIATMDRWVNDLAQNMSTMLIGFNPSTVLKHGPTAAIFSAWEVGGLNWASSMLHLIKEMPGSRQTWRWVMDTSEEARNRLHHIEDTLSNQNRELFGTQTGGFKGKITSLRDAVSWYGHYPVGFADLISAVAMFHAEYKRLNKLDPTMSEGDLRYAANTAIRRTHGSSIVSNRSGIQRHYSPFVRLSMPFYNFLGNALQRNYENAWMAKLAVQGRELPEMTGFLKEKFEAGPQHIKRIIGGVMVFGFAVGLTEWLASKLMGNAPVQKSDESDAAYWAKQILRGYTAQVPLASGFANSLIDRQEPSIGLYGTIARDIGQTLNPKNYNPRNPGKALRTGLDALAITGGLTTSSADKLAEYVTNVLAGHEHPKGFGDLWQGVTHGTQQLPRR
jgi:hypothetical protein